MLDLSIVALYFVDSALFVLGSHGAVRGLELRLRRCWIPPQWGLRFRSRWIRWLRDPFWVARFNSWSGRFVEED